MQHRQLNLVSSILLVGIAIFSPFVAWADSADSETYPGPENPEMARLVNGQSVLKSNMSEAGGTQVFLAIPMDAERSVTANPAKGIGPLPIGFGRPVDVLKTSQAVRSQLRWTPADNGGLVATLSLISPGAIGMRMGIQVERLPDQVELRFFAPGNSAEVVLVSGELVNRLIALNLNDPTADPQQARTYWSPVIHGQSIAVELYLPPGLSPEEMSIAIPQISHLYRSPITMNAHREKGIGGSDSCQVDVMCASTAWQDQGKAVAHMVFTVEGGSYICTGTLLNDTDSLTFIPYFLSANHCFSTQSVASTLDTYWFYRASSCNSGSLSPSSQRLTGGATLLYTAASTDTLFMRLNSNPPAGVWFSGWNSATLAVGTSITGLHNPSGDLQKISTGTVTGYATCVASSSGGFSCSEASSTNGDHLVITWSQGVTEGGSSGSGLFSHSNFRLIGGQLHGGSASCSNPTASDKYGRFDQAYERSLSQWLNAVPSTTTTTAVEFYHSGKDHYFNTANPGDIAFLEANPQSGWFKTGYTFKVYPLDSTLSGTVAVARYYGALQRNSGIYKPDSHFYTGLANERQILDEGYRKACPSGQGSCTGEAWYYEKDEYRVYLPNGVSCPSGSLPVYRFYNNGYPSKDSNHRYTTDIGVAAEMRSKGWQDEGVKMCAAN